MTRKMALEKVLELLDKLEQTEENRAVHKKLEELLEELPVSGWSRRAIVDSLEQFVLESGRLPRVSDLRGKGLPDHTVIANRFGMSAGRFLEEHFPSAGLSRRYGDWGREEWQALFVEHFHRLPVQTAGEYNRSRPIGTPTWNTVAGMFGYSRWSDWLSFCGLEPKRRKKPDRVPGAYRTTVVTKIEEEYHRLHG